MHERLLSLVELLQVHDVHFLQMTIFLHLTAPTTAYLLPDGRSIFLEPVTSNLRFLVSEFDRLSDLFLFLGVYFPEYAIAILN